MGLSKILIFLMLIGASPIPPIISRSLEPNSCSDLSHCRTIGNIIWSCIVTILSCTWVSVHSDIPCPKKRDGKSRFQRWIWNRIPSLAEKRLRLFLCALLVPEYILAWAIRQYLSAREIAHKNEGELDTPQYVSITLTRR